MRLSAHPLASLILSLADWSDIPEAKVCLERPLFYSDGGQGASLHAELVLPTKLISLTDLEKKPEDFGKPADAYHLSLWRALSAKLIPGYWLDFSHEGGLPLKEAAAWLGRDETIILPNHDKDVTLWVGKVVESWWNDQGGDSLPGIDAYYLLDRSRAQKVGDLVDALEFGAVKSTSLSVSFEWKPSHPKLKPEDFFWKLGEQIDGQTVRILVTKVTGFNEASLVYRGADSAARRKDAPATGGGAPLAYPASVQQELAVCLSAFTGTTPLTQEPAMDEILKMVAALMGLTTPLKKEELEARFREFSTGLKAQAKQEAAQALADKQTALEAAQGELTTLKTELTEARTELATLKPLAAAGTKALEGARKEAVRLFKLANGVEGDVPADLKPLVDSIESADLDTVGAHISTYQKLAANKLGGTRALGAPLPKDGTGRTPAQERVVRSNTARFASYLYGDSEAEEG